MDHQTKPPGGVRPPGAEADKISEANNLRQQVEQRMKTLQGSEECKDSYAFLLRFTRIVANFYTILSRMKEEERWNKDDDLGKFWSCILGHYEYALQVAMHLDDGFKEVPGYINLCHLVDLDTGAGKRGTNPFADVHICKTDRDMIAYPRDERVGNLRTLELASCVCDFEPEVPESCSPEALKKLWERNDDIDGRIARFEAQLKDGFDLLDRFMNHIFDSFLHLDGYNVRISVCAVEVFQALNKPLLAVKKARQKVKAAAEPDDKLAAEGHMHLANKALIEAKVKVLIMFRNKPEILEFTGMNMVSVDENEVPAILAAMRLTGQSALVLG